MFTDDGAHRVVTAGVCMSEKTERFLTTEMANELNARRAGLLAERRTLEGAQARILEIDELVEAIDAEMKGVQARAAALPEVARAEPA